MDSVEMGEEGRGECAVLIVSVDCGAISPVGGIVAAIGEQFVCGWVDSDGDVKGPGFSDEICRVGGVIGGEWEEGCWAGGCSLLWEWAKLFSLFISLES